MSNQAKKSGHVERRAATLADVERAFASMWSHANECFSQTDRDALNSYRRHLVKLVEQIQDEVHSLPDERRYANLCRLAASLERNIKRIPILDKQL
jgi:hypothetical protein